MSGRPEPLLASRVLKSTGAPLEDEGAPDSFVVPIEPTAKDAKRKIPNPKSQIPSRLTTKLALERPERFFAEFTLERPERFFASLRMTGSEGLRMTGSEGTPRHQETICVHLCSSVVSSFRVHRWFL
jgi:hypothetical protein